MKRCAKCKEEKETKNFSKNNSSRDGFDTRCKECVKIGNAAWYIANREKVLARNAARHAANRDNINAARRAWRAANPDRVKAWYAAHRDKARISYVKKRYGLSPDEHKELLNKFDHKCAACRSTKKLCVDHDHETGYTRGILCDSCNKALGLLRDDINRIMGLEKYARQHVTAVVIARD